MGLVIDYQGQKIDLTPPWPCLTVSQAFTRFAGWDPLQDFDPLRFDDDTVNKVIPAFPEDSPIILMDYPAEVASLARIKPDDWRIAERAEVFIGGLELANAYSELNDAAEQKRRFEIERDQIERQKGYRLPLPQAFLDAVGYMPVCGGIALGMERLLMLLCDAGNIDEVLAFTADTA
jgi:lysyl-tRNA synthetase class 2